MREQVCVQRPVFLQQLCRKHNGVGLVVQEIGLHHQPEVLNVRVCVHGFLFFKNSMSEKPNFSLAYTSVRAQAIPNVVKLWNDRSKFKDLEWVIAVDDGDAESAAAAVACNQAVMDKECRSVTVVVNSGSKDCVTGWNLAASKTTGKVIICVSDDFLPPQDWDALLLALKPEGWTEQEKVVHVNDGYVFDILVLVILTRLRYERYGYVFYPKYQSMFCDTELGSVAYRDGAVIEAMHLMFEHQHPDCHKRVRDTHDLQHASQERWNSGQMLYEFRKKLNYPLDDGPKAAVAVTAAAAAAAPAPGAKTDEYVVYMQVTQDDFCLEEVCVRMVEEGVKTFFWSEPDEYWSGEPIEPQYLTQLFRVQGRLQDRLGERINIYRRTFHVKSYRLPGDSRIAVETRVRNDSLAWIREQGYHHILIVDGDELWTHGTLELVKKFVEQDNTAISIRMVPAIGLPSYPVEQATDVAVVYIGLGDFKVCRSPHTRQTIIPLNRVIHFSGTRRTMEETISKHRRGGHYDDPDYDFETWLREVLPNICPDWNYVWPNGTKGYHMYKKWQIWPSVRHWRPEELAEIPVSLHAFLGK